MYNNFPIKEVTVRIVLSHYTPVKELAERNELIQLVFDSLQFTYFLATRSLTLTYFFLRVSFTGNI